MPTNRRDFVKASAAIAAVTGARAAFGQPAGGYLANPSSDTMVDDLALEALNAAQAAGASYADARIGRYRRQFVATRERNVTGVNDSESYGIGVRALVQGSWGFASTSTMTKDGITKAAQEAVRLAKAARTAQRRARTHPAR